MRSQMFFNVLDQDVFSRVVHLLLGCHMLVVNNGGVLHIRVAPSLGVL